MNKTLAILVGRNLTRRRSGSGDAILDNIDFSLFAGDRVGLVGQSGSGKSSLFRTIVKLDPIESGEILYHGKSPLLKEIPAFRRRVVYVPQRPSFATGTVRENLAIPLRLASSVIAGQEVDYESWLDEVGKSKSFLDQAADHLSGGEQQIVSLLRAIQLKPEVLLLDEPTASLDPDSTVAIEHLIDVWFKSSGGRAYVWTSHDAEQIRRRCDRVVNLESGRVVPDDSNNTTCSEGSTL